MSTTADEGRSGERRICWIRDGALVVAFEDVSTTASREIEVVIDDTHTLVLASVPRPAGEGGLRNGGFSAGVDGWRLIDSPTADLGVDLAPEWTLQDGHTAFVRDVVAGSNEAVLCYVGDTDDGLVRVPPGREYELSALLGTHRCAAEARLGFLDERMSSLGQTSRQIAAGHPGGRDERQHARVRITGSPPPGAAWVRLSFIKSATIGAATDSYLFVTGVGLLWSAPDAGAERSTIGAPTDLSTWIAPAVVSFPLPAIAADGLPHTLRVRDSGNGALVPGSPLSVQPMPAFDGGVEGVSGSTLIGWARSRDDGSRPATVAISIDGREAVRVTADQPHDTGAHGFTSQISRQVLDGGTHHILLRALPEGVVIDQRVMLFPRVLTPWDALQTHASAPLPGSLAPQAEHRYRSLRSEMASAAQGDDYSSTRLPQLAHAHEVLLRGPDHNRSFEPLVFPVPSEPLVSVVVPAYDGFATTYNCLAALLFAHSAVSFEVILIDDASSDRTRELQDLVSGITYIRNPENLGFLRSCNIAAARAKGRYLAILNNDTEPTAGWLDEMVTVFDNYADVGLTGSKLLYPDGRLQEAGGIVWASGDPWNYGRDYNPHLPQFNYTREVDYVSGAAMLIDRGLWDEVGGFSDEYAPAYFEDTDLAFKVRAAGRRVVYAPHSVVFHVEGGSNGTDAETGTKAHQEINRPKFKAKWAESFRSQPVDDSEPRHAADARGWRRRALFVDYATPQPDRSAGAYAAIQEMRLLQALGYKVTFFPENLAWLGVDTEDLQRTGVETVCTPHYHTLGDLLEERGSEFHVAYLTRFDTALRSIDPLRRLAPQAHVLLQLADLHFLRQTREAESGVSTMELALGTRDQELRAVREVDATLSYSDFELDLLREHGLPPARLALAPWVVDPEPSIPPLVEREGIVFLASKSHPPNRQALAFFCDEVMPLIRARRPGTVLHVYGYGWDEEDALRHDVEDVSFHGFVEHVGEAFGAGRVAVAPLLSGAGLKGKVVEALSHGLPQVLSPIAVEGVGVEPGVEAFVAQTAEEWAEMTLALCDDDELWADMSSAAHRFAEANYSFERGLELMRRALEVAGEPPPDDTGTLAVVHARPVWRLDADRAQS